MATPAPAIIKAPPTTPKALQAQVSAQATRAWAAHDAGAAARQNRVRPPAHVSPVSSPPAPVAPVARPRAASVGPGTTRSAAPAAAPFVPGQGRPAPAATVGGGQGRPTSSMARAIAAAEARKQ
jgi:hypothetical protein